jgi:biotin/methionine sulfoxide reductase
MQQVVDPVGEARDDYDVFWSVAGRLGVGEVFSEGRTSAEWIRHLYETWVDAQPETTWPKFEEWRSSGIELPAPPEDRVFLSDFREDPVANPLDTPSGRIELFSERIHEFGYDDCPGHPTWLEPDEYLGSERAKAWPLHLIANQPTRRLHSQLDAGRYSQAGKIQGREVLRMHPADAAARELRTGDIVRVHNDRGACLAGLITSDTVRRGVVQMPTGAWYDPHPADDERALCISGNVNVLTADVGTSRLAQGTTGQHVLVEVTAYRDLVPPIRAYGPPTFKETT